jgi:hypothetical protein
VGRGVSWGGPYIAERGGSGRERGGGVGQWPGMREASTNGRELADVWAVQGSDVGGKTSAGEGAGAGRREGPAGGDFRHKRSVPLLV